MHINLKTITCIFLSLLLTANKGLEAQNTNTAEYVHTIREELKIKWPKNRTINFVFHGHSVPTGYLTGGVIRKMTAYPTIAIKLITIAYPFASINVITTSIGGEQSEQGAKRFKDDVLNHKPDILFVDYALNDRSIGLDKAKKAWESMIRETLANRFLSKDGVERETKLILLTPTPDLLEDILNDDAELAGHAEQIRGLARKYNVGLIDSYAIFKNIAEEQSLKPYMAQNNHINEKGHAIVGEAIAALFLE